MNISGIVYTSKTGHTQKYAEVLGRKTSLPVFPASEAVKKLPAGSTVIYMGWICAGIIKGYSKTAKRFNIAAVCGVGMSDTSGFF